MMIHRLKANVYQRFYLKNDHGDIILKGGPYYNQFTTHHSNICLADGTYNFTIFGGNAEYGLLVLYALNLQALWRKLTLS